jgi:hypothetical protein
MLAPAPPPAQAVKPRRLDAKDQMKNKEAMLALEHDLMFMDPMIQGFSLEHKAWSKKTQP